MMATIYSRTSCIAFFGFVVAASIFNCEQTLAQGSAAEAATPVLAPPLRDVPSDLQEQSVAEPASTSPGEKPQVPVSVDAKPIGSEFAPSIRIDEVQEYLWNVYQRSSIKSDSHGDFSWKDATAAAMAGLTVDEYVIGGMDSDFREQLFAIGHAMDAAGINWTILSGFRDDYRQSIATGFRARVGKSFHGGSAATGGYGHGCAVDLASSSGVSDETVWTWLDKHGRQFGLFRPLRVADPAHVQPSAGWHELGAALRNKRLAAQPQLKSASAAGSDLDDPISPPSPDRSSDAGLSEDQFECARSRLVEQQKQKAAIMHRLKSHVARAPVSNAGKSRANSKLRTAGGDTIRRMNLRSSPSRSHSGQVKRKGRAHLAAA